MSISPAAPLPGPAARRGRQMGDAASVSALLAARIDRLHDDERAIVGCAAVIGTVFYAEAIAALTGTPLREVQQSLGRWSARSSCGRRRQTCGPVSLQIPARPGPRRGLCRAGQGQPGGVARAAGRLAILARRRCRARRDRGPSSRLGLGIPDATRPRHRSGPRAGCPGSAASWPPRAGGSSCPTSPRRQHCSSARRVCSARMILTGWSAC